MRRALMAMAMVMVLALAGCVNHEEPLRPPVDLAQHDAVVRQQAREALDRFEAAYAAATGPAYVPALDLYAQAGAGEDARALLYDRRFAVAADLPYDVPAGTTLHWPSGKSRPIVALTATQALDIKPVPANSTFCVNCPPVQVLRARLLTVDMPAVDGPVALPAWEYTLAGYTTRIVVPAVRPDEAMRMPEPPYDAVHGPAGVSIWWAFSTSDGRTLTAHFPGGSSSPGPCGEDYPAEVLESEHAVVVMIFRHPHGVETPHPNVGCAGVGYDRQVDITLSQPLGNRVVLDGTYGRRVGTRRG